VVRRESAKLVYEGSIPSFASMFFADVAQLGERHLAKVEVVGSNPIIRSKFFAA
jgi:hypothetical protein